MTLQKIPVIGGVNQLLDERDIDDTQVVYTKNIVPLTPGRIGKRQGLGVAATADTANLYKSTFQTIYKPSDELQAVGLNLITCQSVWQDIFGAPTHQLLIDTWIMSAAGVLTSAANTDQVGKYIILTNFGLLQPMVQASSDGRIFVLVGKQSTGSPGVIIQTQGTSYEVINWNFNGANPFGADVFLQYKSRTVFLSLSNQCQDRFLFSDPGDPGTVVFSPSTDLFDHTFTVGSDGAPLTAGCEVLPVATGTQGTSVMLLFKEYTSYQVTGQPGLANAATADDIVGTVQISQIHIASGCISQQSIATSPYGTLWCGHDDVWLFNVGQLPVRVGSKIRTLITAIPVEYRYLVHGIYHNGFYKLSLPSLSQELNPNMPLQDMWWLDLRFGAPQDWTTSMWYGPQGYQVCDETNVQRTGTKLLYIDQNPGKPQTLLTMDNVWNGVTGQEVPTLLQFDVNEGIDISSLQNVNLEFDNKPIATEILSKEYDFGDGNLDKIYVATEVSLATTRPVQLELEAHIDGGAQVDTAELTLPQNGFVLDIAKLDTNLLTRQFQSRLMPPSDVSQRFIGKTLQLLLRDKPGFIVDTTTTSLSISIASVTHVIPVTPGYYTDMIAFLSALITNLDFFSGGTSFTHNQTNSPTRGAVVITGTNAFQFLWLTGGASSQKLGAALGYDVSADSASVTTQTAPDTVPLQQSAQIDFGNLNLNFTPIPRRPS